MLVVLNSPNWPQGQIVSATVNVWYTAADNPYHIHTERDLPARIAGLFHLVIDPAAEAQATSTTQEPSSTALVE